MLNPLFCWRSSIARNSSLLTGFIKNRFAGKDRKKPFSLKWVFYRGLTELQARGLQAGSPIDLEGQQHFVPVHRGDTQV